MKLWSRLVVVVLLLLGCSMTGFAQEDATIAELLENSEDSSIFFHALVASNMLSNLANTDNSFTAFVPSDSAFAAAELDLDTLLAEPDSLRNRLQYYLVEGKILSADLEDGMKLE